MKKLNRKGFTLVELLAVIIILAIVVGISIPAVLTTTRKAQEKTFILAADNAADWFDRQYQVATTGLNGTEMATLDANFIDACNEDGSKCNDTDGYIFDLTATDTEALTIARNIVGASGLEMRDIEKMHVKINSSTGRTCVILTAKSGGDYYGLIEGNQVASNSCEE